MTTFAPGGLGDGHLVVTDAAILAFVDGIHGNFRAAGLPLENCRVAVRTFLPRAEPVVPTISGVFPAADWHERETFDFYGVHFQGHPNLIRILLPEDADFHPLLKDFMP